MREYHSFLFPMARYIVIIVILESSFSCVSRDYFWNDYDCDDSAHYICEHKCFDVAGNRSPWILPVQSSFISQIYMFKWIYSIFIFTLFLSLWWRVQGEVWRHRTVSPLTGDWLPLPHRAPGGERARTLNVKGYVRCSFVQDIRSRISLISHSLSINQASHNKKRYSPWVRRSLSCVTGTLEV